MTVTPDQLFRRQTGFYAPQDHPHDRVTFVGVGGIGSFAALATAKLGVPSLTLIDPDSVEAHNVPNQFSPLSKLGLPKTHALEEEIASHMGEAVSVESAVRTIAEWEGEYRGVVVSGLDSMTPRHELWEKLKMNVQVPLYIDGRIAGQRMILYSVNPTNLTDIQKYEETLHADGEAEPANCTERGLIDVGFQIAALITRQVRMHLTGQEVPKLITMNMQTLTLRKGDWL